MTEPLIRDVADTAFMVAAYRAAENERPNALYRDPLAAVVAGEEGRRIVTGFRHPWFGGWAVPLRTVIIDDLLRSVVEEGGADTVLNLGAGLDTRPYRLRLPGEVRYVEVDRAPLLEVKEERLAGNEPLNPVRRVAMDLTDRDARRALFEEVGGGASRVVVLTEGVIPYLSNDDVAGLADDLAAAGAPRWWIADRYARTLLRLREKQGMAAKMENAPFLFDPDDYAAFFAEHGWEVTRMRYFMDEARRLRRAPPGPPWLRALLLLRSLFLSRAKKEAFRTLSGYALMERSEG